MNEIWQMSAIEQAAGIKAKRFSAVEAVQSSIARMKDQNKVINAMTVDLSEEALATARIADAAQAAGMSTGPLHGVPVTVKHNVDFKGQANANGVAALLGNIAKADSPLVANLRKAGAIPIGLTNTPEFSLRAFTENPTFGRTLNPWNHEITCGGSSGGAGASVAVGIGAIAHGNDIGGSLRWPAFVNGIATIRPTQGRIPAYNPTAAAERPLLAHLMSTQGPLARSIADVRLGLQAMMQPDHRDPFYAPVPFHGPALEGPLKVAVAEMPEDFYEPDPAVLAAVDEAARRLKDRGYIVERVKVPDLRRPLDLWFKLMGAEIRTLQAGMMEMASPPMKKVLQDYLDIGGPCDLATYMAGLAERNKHVRDWQVFMQDYPIVLTPLCFRASMGVADDLVSLDQTDEIFKVFLFQTALNFIGVPACVVPTGLHKGNPIGVQVIASRFREDLALAASEAIEAETGILAHQLWQKIG